RVYKTGDIRAKILREFARKAAAATGQMKWEQTADVIENVMAKEKNLLPNLDWPAGRLYHCLGLEVPLYTPIFVMSRVAGGGGPPLAPQGQQRPHSPHGPPPPPP